MDIKFLQIVFFSIALVMGPQLIAQDAQNPCIENMSETERNNLEQVQEGMMVYNTTTNCLNYYQGGRWRLFCEENQKTSSDNVEYNEETGELKYKINGQWYTFKAIGPSQTAPAGDSLFFSSTTSKEKRESTVNLPADCKRKPTRPYAGRDLVGFEFVDLEGNQPLHGKGYWSINRGEGGKFEDSTVSNTRFYGNEETTYELKWTIATECDTLEDIALVRIAPPCDPIPSLSYAGSDQINVIEARLRANKPFEGEGRWMIVSGLGGNFENPLNPKSKFFGQPGETYVLRWVIRNHCGLTQDDVIIKFKPPCSPLPSPAIAGEDIIDVDKVILNAVEVQDGEGRWSVIEGKNAKFAHDNLNKTRFYGDPGEVYILRWTVSTKCGSNSDDIRVKFASYCPDQIIDARDGTRYKSKRLAGQCWMLENLKYRPDGVNTYCYDDLASYCNEFGALYSWTTAMNGKKQERSQGLCPKGWHVPSDEEWQQLIDSSGYSDKEFMKGGSSGLEVILSGSRYTNGKYFNRREYAYYWSSTSKNDKTAWNRYFPSGGVGIDHYATDKGHGFSLRCVKDED